MNRKVLIIGGIVVGILALAFFFYLRPNPDVVPMGDQEDATIQWISLAVSIVGFLTACVSLYKEVLSARVASTKD